jgi:hypothetical protein
MWMKRERFVGGGGGGGVSGGCVTMQASVRHNSVRITMQMSNHL